MGRDHAGVASRSECRSGAVWQPVSQREPCRLAREPPVTVIRPIRAAVRGRQNEFISLQKGDAVDQCRFRTVPLHDWTSRLDDFADTAGLIANLDLVISVDTAVVHLAAALGKPVWSLNRYDSCSPWLQGRQIPWYDNAREFRQPTWGDWDTVLQRVCTELKKCASGAQTPDVPWSRS